MSTLTLPQPSLARIAARSAAVNIPLFAAAGACCAAMAAYFTRPTAAQQKRAFLKALATAADCPDDLFLRYLAAEDPVDLAKDELRYRDETLSAPLRKGLAAAL